MDCWLLVVGVGSLIPQEKHSRLKRYKRLAEMEDAICDSLGEETKMVPEQQFQKFPSEEDLAQFRKRIEELEEKKVGCPACSQLVPRVLIFVCSIGNSSS